MRCVDYQKLEREARICRMLKHPTIGKYIFRRLQYLAVTEPSAQTRVTTSKKAEKLGTVACFR